MEMKIIIETVNINKILVDAMKNIPPPEGFIYEFCEADENLNVEADAKIIISHEKIFTGHPHKYILCTSHPEKLNLHDLDCLIDLWACPLNVETVKFYFTKLQKLISSDLHDTEYHQKIFNMAHYDFLTGLATRWYLNEYIEANRDEINITCIYLDLDHLKILNDTYGHLAGDEALVLTAQLIMKEFHDGFSARLGGDEFVVVLFKKVSTYEIEKRVSSFIKSLSKIFRFFSLILRSFVSLKNSSSSGKKSSLSLFPFIAFLRASPRVSELSSIINSLLASAAFSSLNICDKFSIAL